MAIETRGWCKDSETCRVRSGILAEKRDGPGGKINGPGRAGRKMNRPGQAEYTGAQVCRLLMVIRVKAYSCYMCVRSRRELITSIQLLQPAPTF